MTEKTVNDRLRMPNKDDRREWQNNMTEENDRIQTTDKDDG